MGCVKWHPTPALVHTLIVGNERQLVYGITETDAVQWMLFARDVWIVNSMIRLPGNEINRRRRSDDH